MDKSEEVNVNQVTKICARWCQPESPLTKPLGSGEIRSVFGQKYSPGHSASLSNTVIYFCHELNENLLVISEDVSKPLPIDISQAIFCLNSGQLLGVVLQQSQLIIREQIIPDIPAKGFRVMPQLFYRLVMTKVD